MRYKINTFIELNSPPKGKSQIVDNILNISQITPYHISWICIMNKCIMNNLYIKIKTSVMIGKISEICSTHLWDLIVQQSSFSLLPGFLRSWVGGWVAGWAKPWHWSAVEVKDQVLQAHFSKTLKTAISLFSWCLLSPWLWAKESCSLSGYKSL